MKTNKTTKMWVLASLICTVLVVATPASVPAAVAIAITTGCYLAAGVNLVLANSK